MLNRIICKIRNIWNSIPLVPYTFKNRNILFWKGTKMIIKKTALVDAIGACEFNKPLRPPYSKTCASNAMMYLGDNAKLSIKNFHSYQGASIYVFDNARLSIGDGTFLNVNSNIKCWNSITIGKDCAISDNVEIRDSDNHNILRDDYKISAPIVIEDHVWIGLRCIILKGVTIGEGSIVAAGSIVTKSCPPHSLIAGSPARVIKKKIEWKL